MSFHVSLEKAIKQLQEEQASSSKEIQHFTVLMQEGKMSVEYYAPKISDTQKPHGQDEIYIIASGHGLFYRNGERVEFNAGDVIYVPAEMDHRFENFSEDFATWVIFY